MVVVGVTMVQCWNQLKDFTELMKDKRYAPGLAKARTPRQALEAIAAAGYAGGESIM
jgi:flagellum-specific peptidoglycan hydrolase FlgJ